MANWFEILNNMSDTEFKTAKEIGVAAQTLTALVNRGYVEKKISTPMKYKRTEKSNIYFQIFKYINSYPKQNSYVFYKEGSKYGMLCTIKGNDILDCNGDTWDISNVVGIVTYVDGKPFRVPFSLL